MTRRLLDVVGSFFGLILLSPLLLGVSLLIKLTSSGPVLFCQERVGRGFRPFQLYKFRTMVCDASSNGREITVAGDPRITRLGRTLRRTKIDELPQLLNVLRGDMSLVGPRPEIMRYVEMYRDDYAEVLTVRPGITDLASIKYLDEAALLASSDDPEETYVQTILPDKIALSKEYIRRSSVLFDIRLIWRTLIKLTRRMVFGRRR